MAKAHFSDSDNPIDIRYDNVFKAVFTRNNLTSRKALSSLVSAMMGREVVIKGIVANEPPITGIREKQIRFDINCITDKNEKVNIEMSFRPDPHEPARLEFHAAKLLTEQDIRGAKKSFRDLSNVYQIAILGAGYFFGDLVPIHNFHTYDALNKVALSGKSHIITLELSKLRRLRVVDKPASEMTGYERWGIFIEYLTDKSKRDKINEIISHEEGIKMATEELMQISRSDEERARLMSEYKYEVDLQSQLVNAKQEGREEGISIGEERGREEGITIGEERAYQSFAALLKRGLSTDEIMRRLEEGQPARGK